GWSCPAMPGSGAALRSPSSGPASSFSLRGTWRSNVPGFESREPRKQREFPVDIPAITLRLGRLMSWRQSSNGEGLPHRGADELPLRSELYSVDQLERHARALAASHLLATKPTPDQLIPRLD